MYGRGTTRLKNPRLLPIPGTVGVDLRKSLACLQLATLGGVVVATAAVNRGDHWQPLALLALLVIFGLLSEALTVEGRVLRISGSFIAIVFAMVTLGPGPAALVALSGIAFDAMRSRPAWPAVLTNATAYAMFAMLGGLAFMAVEPSLEGLGPFVRGTAIVIVFMATNLLNFILIAVGLKIYYSQGTLDTARRTYLPLLPSQVATGVLTAMVDMLYHRLGIGSLVLAAIVALIFQHLLRTTMASVQRAEELEERTLELAGLQVGLITTVLRTLSLRDKMTARHSAAVARYAREVACELGLDGKTQDTIHTAALLHDIGKFIFPDDILFSGAPLSDEQFAIVRRHPEQGARLVRRLHGFEEVAAIIHAHHERMDGRGYPRRLPAADIPLGSRIISVCDTYDVMTARDSYREPVTPAVAIAELRRVAGTQLDRTVVEAFVRMVAREGIGFGHHDDADFEAELDAEHLVARHAAPRIVA